MQPARRVYNWACQKAYSPFAPLWLAFIFLLEMFLFLPMDALLMLFCMHNPERRYIYALVATLSSIVIGLIGYGIGYLLWDSVGDFVIKYLISKDFFERLVLHYNEHEQLAVFLGSFLPIPFKAVTISAGFCKLSVTGFCIAMFFARALRFFLIAEMMQRWGTQIRSFIDRHFGRLVVAFGAKVALTFAFFWVLGN
ncbi:MAG: DedA family protein [Verrucomicrobia bacterium]|nr:DedA family protein [Verrucomicrobiota bacterium]